MHKKIMYIFEAQTKSWETQNFTKEAYIQSF